MAKTGEPQQYSVSVPFLAVCIVLGLIATAEVLYLLNRPSGQTAAPVKKVTPTITPTPAPLFLQVKEPAGGMESASGELLVAGNTAPHTIVALYSDTDDSLVLSDNQGHFENTVVVGEGGTFGVSAFSLTGEERSAYYFAGDAAVSTGSAALARPPKLGAARLKEVLAGPERATLKVKTLAVRQVEAMELRRHAIIGVTAGIVQGVITLAAPVEGAGKILFDAGTVVTAARAGNSDKIALAPGYFIIAIGTFSAGGLQASRIHVIPVAPTSYQDQLPSFNSSETNSRGAGINGVFNNIQQGLLPTLSLDTPTPSPTPMPVL